MSEIESAAGAASIARQHVLTARFMGVDFLPVRLSTGDVTADPDNTPAAAVGSAPRRVDAVVARAVGGQSLSADEKSQALQVLRAQHDRECPHCTVVTYHTQTVFGEGDPEARLMFIGEAPGEDEDRTGRPFVGKAGQKLNDIIKAMGMQRENVYIANILKSRPPENRTPLPDEVQKCSPYLHQQIAIIQPEVIVALGNPATKMLLQTDIGITRLRGQWGMYSHDEVRIAVMPTFHPAYLLRNYTPDTRKKMWSDMQAVLQRLQSSGA